MTRSRTRPISQKKHPLNGHYESPVRKRRQPRPARRTHIAPPNSDGLLLPLIRPDSDILPKRVPLDAESTDVLLLEFIFQQRLNPLLGKQHCPVQSVPFRFGLRVTNQLDTPFPGATVSSVAMHHKETGIGIGSRRRVVIPVLNPGEAVDLWLEETVSQFQGPLWLDCKLHPSEPKRTIRTMQRTFGTKEVDVYDEPNEWGKVVYIQPRVELLQARTNLLILILTLIVLFDTLFGLRNMLNGTLAGIANGLSATAAFLSAIVR